MDILSKLLKALAEEGFRLNLKKCKFAAQSAKYLGHIITNSTITPLKDNIKSIKQFPAPESRKQVRQFLGKVNFYNKYIPNSARTLDPLHKLLRKNVKYEWDTDCKIAFQTIKDYLCSTPILAIYDREAETFVHTDASIEGIGAILKQTQKDGEIKPVAFFSKKLNASQKKKKAIFLECLAIKESLKFWQHWLLGISFTIYTDHKPLENLNIKNRTDDELGDMTHYLSQYNFVIKYKPGKDNVEADCLSRNPVFESNENEEDKLQTVNIVNINDIINDQNSNIEIKNKNNIIMENGVYYRQRKKKKQKIILSEDYSKILIRKVHEHYGHIGINQTESKIRPFYTAPNLLQNIKLTCRQCEVCIKNKTRLNRKFGLMSQLGPAEKPFEIMSVDTIGGFGGNGSSKKYLHLLTDHFTRYAYISCSKTQLARDYTKLIDQIIHNNEMKILLSDQYPALNSDELKEYLKNHSVKLIFTAVDASFSNGLNERLNQTLVNKIRCALNSTEKKVAWTTVAKSVVEAYNSTNHTVTGYSPSYLLNGTPTDLLPPELAKRMEPGKLEEDRKIAFFRSKKSHEVNKANYDKDRTDYKFKKGDMVYVMGCNKLNRSKMSEIRTGPFEIQAMVSDSICRIKTERSKRSLGLYHISKLIPKP